MTSTHRTPLAPLLFIWLVVLAGCATESPTSVDLAITNVTLIDAINPVRRNQTVVIDQGKLVDIIDGGTDRRFVAREHVDGSGRYLIPGLWDFHVHFTFDSRFTDAMAGLFLYHGITNVRDTGGLLKDLLPAVDAVLHSANPLQNIAHTRTVEAVINLGTLLPKTTLLQLVRVN